MHLTALTCASWAVPLPTCTDFMLMQTFTDEMAVFIPVYIVMLWFPPCIEEKRWSILIILYTMLLMPHAVCGAMCKLLYYLHTVLQMVLTKETNMDIYIEQCVNIITSYRIFIQKLNHPLFLFLKWVPVDILCTDCHTIKLTAALPHPSLHNVFLHKDYIYFH